LPAGPPSDAGVVATQRVAVPASPPRARPPVVVGNNAAPPPNALMAEMSAKLKGAGGTPKPKPVVRHTKPVDAPVEVTAGAPTAPATTKRTESRDPKPAPAPAPKKPVVSKSKPVHTAAKPVPGPPQKRVSPVAPVAAAVAPVAAAAAPVVVLAEAPPIVDSGASSAVVTELEAEVEDLKRQLQAEVDAHADAQVCHITAHLLLLLSSFFVVVVVEFTSDSNQYAHALNV